MKGKWEVSCNPICGTNMYIVFRLRNVNETDHSGNREYGSEYVATKEAAQEIADRLNSEAAG